MKKVLFSLSAVALFVVAFASVASAQSLAGEWDLTINTPDGPKPSKFVVKQEGSALSGALKSDQGELATKVALTGDNVKINFSIKFNDADLPITLSGKLVGDMMKGEADFGGLAQGDWSAKRAAGASATAAPSSATASTAGAKWNLTYSSPVGEFPIDLTVTQSGETLSGMAKMGGPTPQEVPVTGTLKGDAVEFKIVIKYEGNDLPIVSKGKITGSEVKGSVDYGGMAEGEFKGKKGN